MLSRNLSRSFRSLSRQHAAVQRRSYNFATKYYHESFKGLPQANREELRDSAIDYLKKFDSKVWYEDPIRTIVDGESFRDGKVETTANAFGEENGKQIIGSKVAVDAVIDHLRNFKPKCLDNRTQVRELEKKLFGPLAGELIGNQALDFKKQDGITEIEEAIQANLIEQRLNDKLLEDETAGMLSINRIPAFVGCVSNFSNFLDLSRKVLRNIELGVPVVVLSRSNTTQHMFRWTQMLLDLMQKHDIELGYVTYASCSQKEARRMFSYSPSSPLYLTGSRKVAESIKSLLPNTMSSTGGPNTFVSTRLTEKISEAVKTSALIENSGQCTALRHAVIPSVTDNDMVEMFSNSPRPQDSQESLETGTFAGLFADQKLEPQVGYQNHPDHPVSYRIDTELPVNIEEHWRKAFVDVTTVSEEEMKRDSFVDSLNRWLIENQPISLAINGDESPYDFAKKLFERTGMVVYTIGTLDTPALTAQARPQDAEVFGEFPPRKELSRYTKFPTIVPSSTPGYNTEYRASFLKHFANETLPSSMGYLEPVLNKLSEEERGYSKLLLSYIMEACESNPRRGFGERTSIYGLQRPPIDGTVTLIRAEKDSSVDNVFRYLLPFVATNARSQVVVSCHKDNKDVIMHLSSLTKLKIESSSAYRKHSDDGIYNIIECTSGPLETPLVSHFLSTIFPLGHIKSTLPNDTTFLEEFSSSPKWLKINNDEPCC